MRIMLLIGILMLAFNGFTQIKSFIDQPYIDVSGTADTLVTPDKIFIRIVISEKDSKDKISIEQQENRLVEALKSLNIETEKKLTVEDLISNFKYHLLRGKDILKTKIYTLLLSDAVTTTKVFIKLEELGIANSDIYKVEYSRIDDLKLNLRSLAMQNAHTKAKYLVSPINQTVGRAINVIDIENSSYMGLQGKVSGLQIRGTLTKKLEEPAPDIEFQKIKVGRTVLVKFILN